MALDPEWAPCGRCDCRDGISPVPDKWEIAGILATNECPRRRIPADAGFWFGLVQHYRNGLLWIAGGVADQPNIYLEVMRFITSHADKLSDTHRKIHPDG